eukprot:TRINITY_DN3171_c0_g1_i1.p1 TRINITY_DN3171_c0_g1~~TRINITY_DN3171_c0_g1_i1.p1  ORF type:complete len:2913 (-),score=712.44 TRINITY_DN3171_c0_g1_i1:125-8794(-)
MDQFIVTESPAKPVVAQSFMNSPKISQNSSAFENKLDKKLENSKTFENSSKMIEKPLNENFMIANADSSADEAFEINDDEEEEEETDYMDNKLYLPVKGKDLKEFNVEIMNNESTSFSSPIPTKFLSGRLSNTAEAKGTLAAPSKKRATDGFMELAQRVRLAEVEIDEKNDVFDAGAKLKSLVNVKKILNKSDKLADINENIADAFDIEKARMAMRNDELRVEKFREVSICSVVIEELHRNEHGWEFIQKMYDTLQHDLDRLKEVMQEGDFDIEQDLLLTNESRSSSNSTWAEWFKKLGILSNESVLQKEASRLDIKQQFDESLEQIHLTKPAHLFDHVNPIIVDQIHNAEQQTPEIIMRRASNTFNADYFPSPEELESAYIKKLGVTVGNDITLVYKLLATAEAYEKFATLFQKVAEKSFSSYLLTECVAIWYGLRTTLYKFDFNLEPPPLSFCMDDDAWLNLKSKVFCHVGNMVNMHKRNSVIKQLGVYQGVNFHFSLLTSLCSSQQLFITELLEKEERVWNMLIKSVLEAYEEDILRIDELDSLHINSMISKLEPLYLLAPRADYSLPTYCMLVDTISLLTSSLIYRKYKENVSVLEMFDDGLFSFIFKLNSSIQVNSKPILLLSNTLNDFLSIEPMDNEKFVSPTVRDKYLEKRRLNFDSLSPEVKIFQDQVIIKIEQIYTSLLNNISHAETIADMSPMFGFVCNSLCLHRFDLERYQDAFSFALQAISFYLNILKVSKNTLKLLIEDENNEQRITIKRDIGKIKNEVLSLINYIEEVIEGPWHVLFHCMSMIRTNNQVFDFIRLVLSGIRDNEHNSLLIQQISSLYDDDEVLSEFIGVVPLLCYSQTIVKVSNHQFMQMRMKHPIQHMTAQINLITEALELFYYKEDSAKFKQDPFKKLPSLLRDINNIQVAYKVPEINMIRVRQLLVDLIMLNREYANQLINEGSFFQAYELLNENFSWAEYLADEKVLGSIWNALAQTAILLSRRTRYYLKKIQEERIEKNIFHVSDQDHSFRQIQIDRNIWDNPKIQEIYHHENIDVSSKFCDLELSFKYLLEVYELCPYVHVPMKNFYSRSKEIFQSFGTFLGYKEPKYVMDFIFVELMEYPTVLKMQFLERLLATFFFDYHEMILSSKLNLDEMRARLGMKTTHFDLVFDTEEFRSQDNLFSPQNDVDIQAGNSNRMNVLNSIAFDLAKRASGKLTTDGLNFRDSIDEEVDEYVDYSDLDKRSNSNFKGKINSQSFNNDMNEVPGFISSGVVVEDPFAPPPNFNKNRRRSSIVFARRTSLIGERRKSNTSVGSTSEYEMTSVRMNCSPKIDEICNDANQVIIENSEEDEDDYEEVEGEKEFGFTVEETPNSTACDNNSLEEQNIGEIEEEEDDEVTFGGTLNLVDNGYESARTNSSELSLTNVKNSELTRIHSEKFENNLNNLMNVEKGLKDTVKSRKNLNINIANIQNNSYSSRVDSLEQISPAQLFENITSKIVNTNIQDNPEELLANHPFLPFVCFELAEFYRKKDQFYEAKNLYLEALDYGVLLFESDDCFFEKVFDRLDDVCIQSENPYIYLGFLNNELTRYVTDLKLESNHRLFSLIGKYKEKLQTDETALLHFFFRLRYNNEVHNRHAIPSRILNLYDEYIELFRERNSKSDVILLLSRALEVQAELHKGAQVVDPRYLDTWHKYCDYRIEEFENSNDPNVIVDIAEDILDRRPLLLSPNNRRVLYVFDCFMKAMSDAEKLRDVERGILDSQAFKFLFNRLKDIENQVEMVGIDFQTDVVSPMRSPQNLKNFNKILQKYPFYPSIIQHLIDYLVIAQKPKEALAMCRRLLTIFSIIGVQSNQYIQLFHITVNTFFAQGRGNRDFVLFLEGEISTRLDVLPQHHILIRHMEKEKDEAVKKGKKFEKWFVAGLYYLFYAFVALMIYMFAPPLNEVLGFWDEKTAWTYFLTWTVEFGLYLSAVYLISWPPLPAESDRARILADREREMALKDAALLIACHNSSGIIETTLKSALKVFKPNQIWICDNANSETPTDNTKEVLDRISHTHAKSLGKSKLTKEDYINYAWVSEGNKTLALWYVTRYHCKAKYVMMTDDDVLLPPDLVVPLHEFEEPNTKALAFTIKAENLFDRHGQPNIIAHFQSLEYELAGFNKLFQAEMGSALCAHGAIAMWDRDALLEVLWNHNTVFNGEDLQMGVILQSLNRNYRMATVGTVCVPTTVPDHAICKRLLNCNCPQGFSLLRQRVRSWDPTAHRFIPTFLYLLLFHWQRNTLILKPFILYELWTSIMDWIRIIVISYLVWVSPLTFLWGAFSVYGVYIMNLCLFNYWVLRHRTDLKLPFYIILMFPLYRYMILLFRMTALLYNLIYYTPFIRNKKRIRDRRDLPPSPEDYDFLHQREREIQEQKKNHFSEIDANPAKIVNLQLDDIRLEVEDVSRHKEKYLNNAKHWYRDILHPLWNDHSLPVIVAGFLPRERSVKDLVKENVKNFYFTINFQYNSIQMLFINIVLIFNDMKRYLSNDDKIAFEVVKWLQIDSLTRNRTENVELETSLNIVSNSKGLSTLHFIKCVRGAFFMLLDTAIPFRMPDSPIQTLIIAPNDDFQKGGLYMGSVGVIETSEIPLTNGNLREIPHFHYLKSFIMFIPVDLKGFIEQHPVEYCGCVVLPEENLIISLIPKEDHIKVVSVVLHNLAIVNPELLIHASEFLFVNLDDCNLSVYYFNDIEKFNRDWLFEQEKKKSSIGRRASISVQNRRKSIVSGISMNSAMMMSLDFGVMAGNGDLNPNKSVNFLKKLDDVARLDTNVPPMMEENTVTFDGLWLKPILEVLRTPVIVVNHKNCLLGDKYLLEKKEFHRNKLIIYDCMVDAQHEELIPIFAKQGTSLEEMCQQLLLSMKQLALEEAQ